jgi:uncharacterized membrane protein YphA (DoxX/SURF4 family)
MHNLLSTVADIYSGISSPWVGLSGLRLAVGVFFGISGYHKLFVTSRHATLQATLANLGIPWVGCMAWFVPACEAICGAFFAVGFLTVPASVILAILISVACMTAGRVRVNEYKPIDAADRLDDWLYLSESMYLGVFLAIALAGPGPFSVDSWLFNLSY